jgi:hypothetical protein
MNEPSRDGTWFVGLGLIRGDELYMQLSRTTVKKAYPYLGICEFCGRVLELSYYDFVLECAVCEECAGDLAAGENALTAAGIACPGLEYFDGSGS